MNKGELVDQVAKKADSITKKQVEQVINATFDVVMDVVAGGYKDDNGEVDSKITLVGFGSFEPRYRKEREGKNPKTGEKLTIAATNVPAFSAGKKFKELVAPEDKKAAKGKEKAAKGKEKAAKGKKKK
jgi:DNA-binding protein HU-beta